MKIYGSKLEQKGITTLKAINGEEALKMAKEHTPNLILLDLILPRIHGFEVLTELKKDPLTKGIPVIILSNLGQGSEITKGHALGAVDYIVKSNTSIEAIYEKIKTFL
jgi:DNA-binding response OmpR family regulator